MHTYKSTLLLIALLGLAALSSCVLQFDAVPDDIDMTVTFSKSEQCADISGYTIVGSQPYDKSFVASLDNGEVIQHWVGMPAETIGLEIKLDTVSGDSYGYEMSISKQWGETARFSAVCDEENPKPVLEYDHADMIGVFTLDKSCRPFRLLELFEEISRDTETGQAVLEPVAASDIPNRRWIYYLHEADVRTPIFVIRLMDGLERRHEFRYPLDLDWGKRFDFMIACDENQDNVEIEAKVDDRVVEADDGSGQADGDSEMDSAENEIESDDDVPIDGDIDGDSEISDSDVTDGDNESDLAEEEQDTADGDLDPDPEVEEEETVCGTEQPSGYLDFAPEEIFVAEECRPLEAVHIVETENVQFDDGQYLRLDATAIGDELVFLVNVPLEWEYRIGMAYVGGVDDWGEVSLYLDDETEPIPRQDGSLSMDLSVPSSGLYDEWRLVLESYRSFCLSAGEHRLKVRVVGTQKTGYWAGVDSIQLYPE